MCFRYFRETGILLPEHARELPRFARRLRKGLPLKGIPFSGELQYGIKRREVRQLLDAGVTPIQILRHEDPARLIAQNGALGDQVRTNAWAIVDEVFAFYRNEIQELVHILETPDSKDQWGVFRDMTSRLLAVEEVGSMHAYGRRSGQGLADLTSTHRVDLVDNLQGMVRCEGDSGPRAAKEPGLKSLLIHSKDGRATLRIRVALPRERDGHEAGADEPAICVRLPWPDEADVPCTAMEVTSCGAMVLAYLVAKDFVPVYGLRGLAAKRRACRVPIENLLEELEVRSLQRELREAIIRFDEPGMD